MKRRKFLAAATLTATALAGCTGSGGDSKIASPLRNGPTIGLELVADGFFEPLALQTANDDERRYVADKYGQIFVQDGTGVRDEPFLDIADQLVEFTSWEQGLLGLELHPHFESNRKFYVRYSSPRREGTPENFNHTFVLSEFRAESNLLRADPDSERVVLEIPQPGQNHNSGAITFGPDGYLYVGVGDGSSDDGGDRGVGHVDDWYFWNVGGNGQDVTQNLRGSILRIDPDGRENGKPYAVPDDNPLVGQTGLDEHWAWGLRNPYRMSFSDGDLYVGDVGDAEYEEVNVVRKGSNFGWNVREGKQCYSNRHIMAALEKFLGVKATYPFCPDETDDGDPLVEPIIAYPHSRNGKPFGRAVVGGYRYQNETVESLRDQYVFADLFAPGSGLFAARPSESGVGLWSMEAIDVAGGHQIQNKYVLSLGRDAAGELYVLTTQFSEGSGQVFRVVPPNS